jgi:hypothetical protein
VLLFVQSGYLIHRPTTFRGVVSERPDRETIEAYTREHGEAGAAIKRTAMEQYIFTLAKGWVVSGKRLRAKYPDVDPTRNEIRDVKLEGEYPDTSLTLLVYSSYRDEEQWQSNRLWDNPDDWYYVKDPSGGRQIEKPEKLLGDIFMWARGG